MSESEDFESWLNEQASHGVFMGGYTPEEEQGARAAWMERASRAALVVEAAPVRKLGIFGKAFDLPTTKPAYTYSDQPDNGPAYRLGNALIKAFNTPQTMSGDSIDIGLALLQLLEQEGFGVFEL